MQSPSDSGLDCFFVDNLEDAEDLIDILRLWLHPLVIFDLIRALEMIGEIGLLESIIFLLLVHLPRNSLISYVLLNIVLLLHELYEVCRIHVRPQLEEHLVKLGLILVFSMIFIYAHLLLHITIVVGHKYLHLAHNLILTLGLYRFLVILQLSCK